MTVGAFLRFWELCGANVSDKKLVVLVTVAITSDNAGRRVFDPSISNN